VVYLVTISDEDHPAGGPFDGRITALSYAEHVSGRVKAKGGRWDGADVRVWETSDGHLDPLLDKLIARFIDGKRVPLGDR
jgi:hypothetical protein